jgi:hypothetical protein
MEPILRCAMSCPEMSLHKVLYGFWLSKSKQMTKTIQEERAHYSRGFKHSVIKEYLKGDIGKSALLKKYNIVIPGSIGAS